MSAVWPLILSVFSIAALETFLSLDNAVVLAMIAKELEPESQKRALSYGLFGAIVLRLGAVGIATKLLHYPWVKILGGIYLGYLAIRFFIGTKNKKQIQHAPKKFWRTVLLIEFTDLAFAVDSIVAAVALTQNYWVVVVGGMIGVITIRFAAQFMIKILAKFPKLESFAYGFIAVIAAKTLYQGIYSFK